MTKIKDLITVHVDTAFRMFPIDCERYELALFMLDRVAMPNFGYVDKSSLSQDTRINDFVVNAEENFANAAESLWSILYDPVNASSVCRDRARRIPPIVLERYNALWPDLGHEDFVLGLMRALFVHFFKAFLLSSQVFINVCPQKDRRNPT